MLEISIKDGKIYSYIRDKWLVCTPEEKVRQEFVCKLVNDFGYPLDAMEEEYKPDMEARGIRSTRADLAVYRTPEERKKNYNAFIVVEFKAENVKIRIRDFYQGTEYANKLHAQFLILHNAHETNFYAVDQKMIPNREDAFTQIATIPKYEEINNTKKIEEIKKQTKTFSREEFTKMLRVCHNIIRNNDKLSPEAAFDEISKILFMKIRFERDKKGVQVFTIQEYKRQKAIDEEYNKNRGIKDPIPFMQTLFNDTKRDFKNDHLFDEHEVIKIRENSFEQIIEKLQIYNLSDTSDDVKGIAFEQFLGTTFRGELGQFFTPRTIVNFMTEILDPQEGELVCDPCCGSGGFLISVFDYVKEKIERDIQERKDKVKADLTAEYPEDMSEDQQIELNERIDKVFKQLNRELEHIHADNPSKYSRLDILSYKSIFGTDANPRMARTSKMNMIMHGDGHGGVHHHDGLININGIFEGRFDVILTNPPFGSSVDKEQYINWDDIENDQERIKQYKEEYGNDYEKQLKELQRIADIIPGDDKKSKKQKSLLNFYETGKMSALTEVLFIERCLRLLKPGGRMGIVLPEGVLNNSNLQKVREYFEGQAKIILICSIPQDVFIKAGATVKPSLVFLKKFTKEESEQYNTVVGKARKTVDEKYIGTIQAIEDEYNTKLITKAIYNTRMKQVELKKQEEMKPLIKEWFDYQIPIAKVEKAGITTTGAPCENELDDVLSEYRAYNAKNPLWDVKGALWDYILSDDLTVSKFDLKKQVVVGDLI
ncbi:MAG: N-6 DNA methylase [Clostridia bacterium]|nr:N-6 DNA methylase [Clostridia bacterium]